MTQHPIKTELDEIIEKYCAGELSYAEAKKSVSGAVDKEISRYPKIMYREIVILGAARQNAFNRLKRKQKQIKNRAIALAPNQRMQQQHHKTREFIQGYR